MTQPISEFDAARALLRWYCEAGVNEATGRDPADFGAPDAAHTISGAPSPRADARPDPGPRLAIARAPLVAADEAVVAAEAAAKEANSVAELALAVARFDGCPLKQGARSTVFTDGIEGADLLVIGEAPGRDEDLQGKPFVGRAGQLLDRMLAAIGRSRRQNVLITNVVFWRPPGNRAPAAVETAICRPFVDRLIELTRPKAVLLAGGAPLVALCGVSGIMRARGVWRDLETPDGAKTPALATFHPAFLLREPVHKRAAWADLLTLRKRLETAG